MKQLLCTIILGFLWGHAHTQKVVQNTFDARAIRLVELKAEYCYEVRVSTHKEKTVEITYIAQGEYQDEVYVSVSEENEVLRLTSGFAPLSGGFNDKLSVHKVVSLALEITVPENIQIDLNGDRTGIFISGNHKMVRSHTDNGETHIADYSGDLEASSYKGNITLITATGTVRAESRYGKVENGLTTALPGHYLLKSVYGNIYVRQKE